MLEANNVKKFIDRLAQILQNFFHQEEEIKKESKQIVENVVKKAEAEKMDIIRKRIDQI